MITRKAYAKINLSLDVLRRREDGYHEVKMIMQSIGIFDELTFERLDDTSEVRLEVTNAPKGADLGPIEKNLVYRAAMLIKDAYNITDGVRITLNKSIPVAAGMAGGSTDAASVFHGMKELFDIDMSDEDMCILGVKLGADIPYCIMGGTYLSEGIGEILTPLTAPPEAVLVICKPDIAVSTKYVYENLHAESITNHPDVDGMIEAIKEGSLKKMSGLLGNVLENVTRNKYPIISDIKDAMLKKGALNSLMSGSGPTVFGIFDPMDEAKAIECADFLKKEGISREVFVTAFTNSSK